MLGLRANVDDLIINIGTAANIEISRNVIIADSAGPPAIKAIPDLGTLGDQTGTGDVTIVDTSGGTSGDTWNVQDCCIANTHASASTLVKVRIDDGTNSSQKTQATLLPGESLTLLESGLWIHQDANGGIYPASFNSINVQVFTASGTYTPTPGMKHCIVIATGAGGGGGGADNDATSGATGVGAGGGAGETRIGFFTAATIGSSQTVTLNAAGTAGSATNGANGGAGGSTTFGSLITANGGSGGTGSGNSAIDVSGTAGGAGGTGGSGGTLAIDGGDGGDGFGMSVDGTTDVSGGMGGYGGNSFWGGGSRGAIQISATLTNAANTAGVAGKAYGSGGSGAVSTNSVTGAAGGAGKLGVILVIEYV
jgi:hypothetical protein